MLDPNDAVWVLDVCDGALGEPSQRGHRFAWLLESADPAAEPARVDAWYPPLRLVVDLRVRDDEEHHRRARIVRAYGLDYVVVELGNLARDPQGRLRRLDRDEERIRTNVGDETARKEQRFEWGGPMSFTVGGQDVVGFAVYADGDDEPGVWADDEDEDWDGSEEEAPWPAPDVATKLDEVGPLDTATAEILGWRGRSMAQALVGALALSRRALGVDVVGEGARDDGLDVLLALAAAEVRESVWPGLSRDEIATALAADPWTVDRSLEWLEGEGHVRRADDPMPDEDDDGAWLLAPPGLALVLEWLGRASALFGDWPRD